MTDDPPHTTDDLRNKGNVIDQRQQQIDPAGHHRKDSNDRPDANRKQPGGTDPDRYPPA